MSKKIFLIFILVTIFLTGSSFLAGITYDHLITIRTKGTRISSFFNSAKLFKYSQSSAEAVDKEAESDPANILYDAYYYIKENYVKGITPKIEKELIYGAIRGMIKSLDDPFSRFMDPKAYNYFYEENKGQFDGIGATLGIQFYCPLCQNEVKQADTTCKKCGSILSHKQQRVVIIAPLEGTPAFKAGIKPGDIILKINNTSTESMSLDDAVGMIRGPAGTQVTITVQRKVNNKPKQLSFNLTRAVIEVFRLQHKVLSDKRIGYIRMQLFNEKSVPDLDRALTALEDKNIRALILDLRDNPGGLLDSAVDISSRFIAEGPIVGIQGSLPTGSITKDKNKKTEISWTTAKPGEHPFWSGPLVVLINKGSASASEIVSGAIQARKVGKVIGVRSFGKATVQQVFPLEDGSAIALTIATYVTPNKTDISKKGITPDIIVEPEKRELKNKKDLQLNKAVTILKQMLSAQK